MYYLAFVRCYHSPEIINCSWQRTLQSQVMSLPIWSLMIHSFILNHRYSLIQDFFFSFLISLFLYFFILVFLFIISYLFSYFPFFPWLCGFVKLVNKVKLCWKYSVTAQTFFSYLRQKHNLQITFSWNIFSLSSISIFSEIFLVLKLLWHWVKPFWSITHVA